MSRKHFIALASALAAAGPHMQARGCHHEFMELVQRIADACASQSTTFNRQRFVDAAFSELEGSAQ